MRVLIIVSEHLNSLNKVKCNFEYCLNDSYINHHITINYLSVRVLTINDLLRSFFIKLFKMSKQNVYSNTITYKNYIYYFKNYLFFPHLPSLTIHSSYDCNIYESVFVSRKRFEGHFFSQKWCYAGYKAFLKVKQSFLPDIIHAHSRFFLAADLANYIYIKDKIKYIITEHSSNYPRNIISNYQKKRLYASFSSASFITAVSKFLAASINSHFDSNFTIIPIPNAVPHDFKSINNSLLNPKDNRLVMVGRLDKNKNHILLFQALKLTRFKNICVDIVGEGILSNYLKSIAKSLKNMHDIKFHGFASPKDVVQFILKSKILVITSIFETFSLVTIESLSLGVPVISTSCGGPEEIITKDCGVVLLKNTPQELASHIDRIMSGETVFKGSCKSEILKVYSADQIVKKYNYLYQKMISDM